MRAARAHQYIDHRFPFEMAAFDEDDVRALAHEGATGALHLLRRPHFLFHENLRFIDVGGDQAGERDESPGDRSLRVRFQQSVTGGRDHDGIEHVVGKLVARDAVGDGFDQLGGTEHSRLYPLRRKVFRQGVELGRHERGRHGLPGANAPGVLRRHGTDDARTEHAELMERLQVGLDPGPAPRVGPGDRKGDSHGGGAAARRLAARARPAKFLHLVEDRIATNLTSTIRDLKRRKARGRRGLALVEGVRLVEEAVSAGVQITGVIVAPELARTTRGTELRAVLARHAVPVQDVPAKAFAPLADTESPQGIIAVVEPRRWTMENVDLEGAATLLVIDAVQDPGNVGTLLRTAHALGTRATIVLRGTADVWGPKTLRAAMGATFRHPVISLDDVGFIAWARRQGVTLWATASDGEPLQRALQHREPGVIAVVVGNEGAGIRPHLNAVSARRVAIPLAQGAESLNVAVAAGILLYEVSHGR